MKRTVAFIIALAILLFGAAALAAGTFYNDAELGFSFELPLGFEYKGDVLDTVDEDGGADGETADDLEQSKQFYDKQILYDGLNSYVLISYVNSKELIDEMARSLPHELEKEEIDFYLMGEDEKETNLKTAAKELEGIGFSELEILGNEYVDYGGKLCLVTKSRYKPYETDPYVYQCTASFIYKDYTVSIAYVEFDMNGSMKEATAFDGFDAALSTLEFEIVPTDTEARLVEGLDLNFFQENGLLGVLLAAAIGLIIFMINRRKRKNREK